MKVKYVFIYSHLEFKNHFLSNANVRKAQPAGIQRFLKYYGESLLSEKSEILLNSHYSIKL